MPDPTRTERGHRGPRRLAAQRRKVRRRRVALRSRRRFVLAGLGLMAGGVVLARRFARASPVDLESEGPPVRPPTAHPDDAVFQAQCIRCGLCSTVCENGCIRTFGLDETRSGALTPYLDLRRRSCTLCMRCTEVCPTGALTKVADDLDSVLGSVRMGTAKVERDLCLSYLGRVCGTCFDACPLPNRAIRLTPPALPVVLEDCVGCGRCVELCPQVPTAISVTREGTR